MTDKYFKLPLNIGKKLKRIISSPNVLKNESETLFKKMYKGGFIIDDFDDELAKIKNKYNQEVESKNIFLSILPTMNCNYSCWYCYQQHTPSIMTSDTIAKIKKHIDYLISEEKITSLHVEWFGGEPFMYFSKIIEPLSKYFIDKCNKAGIPYTNSATTNAFFINSEIINKFEDLLFNNLHISLDGFKEAHDKVKCHPTINSAFDHTLQGINKALKDTKNLKILLRINYTNNNLSPLIVNEICKKIDLNLRSRIKIYFRKIWQENNSISYLKTLRPIINDLERNGFEVEYWSKITDFVPCYVNRRHFVAIMPAGGIVKCTASNDFQLNTSKGVIDISGKLLWEDDYCESFIGETYNNKNCLSCSLLPCCMGPCPQKVNHSNDENFCKLNHPDYNLSERICDYIDSKYKN